MAIPVYHVFPYGENNKLIMCMYGRVWPRPNGCWEIWIFMDVDREKPEKQIKEWFADIGHFFKGTVQLSMLPIENMKQWLINMHPVYICDGSTRYSEIYRQFTLDLNKEIYGD